MQATINNRKYEVISTESIDGALSSDLQSRGWEPAFYTLKGKRGSTKVCLRSAKTGEFSEL